MANTGPDDVWFELDLGDGRGYRKIGPGVMESIPEILEEETAKILVEVAGRLEYVIRARYQDAIQSRPRTDESESLRDRVLEAVKSNKDQILQQRGILDMGVFDLDQVIAETSKPEDRPVGGRSVYEMMEEGYRASDTYGFIPLEYAVSLAERAAKIHDWPAAATARFVNRVREAFAGKHGNGIMVEVFKPLFWEFGGEDDDGGDYFGTPFDFGIMPHSGWEGWHALDDIAGMRTQAVGMTGGTHWLDAVMYLAVENTGKRLQTIMG